MIDALDDSKRKIKCIKTQVPMYPGYTNGKMLLKRGHTYTLIEILTLGWWDEVVLEEFPEIRFDARLFEELQVNEILKDTSFEDFCTPHGISARGVFKV